MKNFFSRNFLVIFKSVILGLFFSLTVTAVFAAISSENKIIDQRFVEENNLNIPVGAKNASDMTSELFNKIIDSVEEIYAPIVAQKGGVLKIERNWDDGTVNAYASRSGNQWSVSMFGGLARHQTITADGFALVVCHELGHHLAGAPKIQGYFNRWASNEGQSDYFANLKCLRRVMENDDNESIVRNLNVPTYVADLCEKSFNHVVDIAICKRGAMAGKSVGDLFVALNNNGGRIDFTTPDRTVVTRTNDSHPAPQCRLDTYLSGSICVVGVDEELSDTNPNIGTCARANGHDKGIRPLCWFKP